jgi:hypothetical protein
MIGKIKKFNQKLYDKYDIPARQIIKEKIGEDNVKDNEDIYAEDMIITHPKCRYKYLELQACAEWVYNDYPHEKPFVFERKGHFNDDTLFIIFNKHFTKLLLFSKVGLHKNPIRLKKYSRFYKYEVGWSYVFKIQVDDLSIDNLLAIT